MELKIKLLKWSAGLPVAMINKKTAEKIGANTKDRISIKTLNRNSKEVATIVDIIQRVVREGEIAVSSELSKKLNIKQGQKVEVDLTQTPKSINLIKKKLNGKRLSKKEIREIIRDIVKNYLSEPEIALFVSAMYKHGMVMKEIIYLIEAILKYGSHLKLKNKHIVDKHSIGGIAGNRTTPIVVSICAAAGLTFPKTSSRAITSAAGTTDVIETVAKVEFEMKDLKKIIQKTNACIVWGGALGMVPADSKIIKVEKALKIDPPSQLLASIMSKKLAVGSKYIIIDIPYGSSAKVDKKKALNLKRKFEYLGKHFKKKLKVVLTKGTQPIGNGIGPALELKDVIQVLDPVQKGPKDLQEKSIFLAAQLLEMTGKTKNGIKMAEEILSSGKAFEKFKEIIKAQGGSLKKIKAAKFNKSVFSKKSGEILEINNKKINSLARIAGCPASKFSGVYLHFHVGDKIKKREKLLTIYSESASRLRQAIKYYDKEKPVRLK